MVLTRRKFMKLSLVTSLAVSLPDTLFSLLKNKSMEDKQYFDVIIVGGSYAGLSAAMALGRALKKVLIIDAGKPCNRQTPHSHNFITQDGVAPNEIANLAKQQVLKYETVHFREDSVVTARRKADKFEITTHQQQVLFADKIILATGIKDIMPDIPGFSECWGISVIHCPYCHGYEVRHRKTGILANGETAFEMSKMIRNWTDDLILFTNGRSILTVEQQTKLIDHGIQIVEDEIEEIVHKEGKLQSLALKDGIHLPLDALYARVPFAHHNEVAQQLGCELTEQGYIKTDLMQKTTQSGVFACGDNSTMMRSVASAVYTGSMAGAACNREIIEENF